MPWLWYVAPLFFVVLFVVNARVPDERRLAELERWRKRLATRHKTVKSSAGYRSGKQSKKQVEVGGPKPVGAPPSHLARLLADVGGGTRVACYELVPRIAYVSAFESDAMHGSDHTSVLCRLDAKYPSFVARPLPIVEGARVANTGIEFKKDPDFGEEYLVEGDDRDKKAIVKFLGKTVRRALLDQPAAWLRVDGDVMALTLYGPVDADMLEELVDNADVIFAEYGANGGPSLTGDEEDDDASDEDDDEEDASDDEEDASDDEEDASDDEEDASDDEEDASDDEEDASDDEEDEPEPPPPPPAAKKSSKLKPKK